MRSALKVLRAVPGTDCGYQLSACSWWAAQGTGSEAAVQ